MPKSVRFIRCKTKKSLFHCFVINPFWMAHKGCVSRRLNSNIKSKSSNNTYLNIIKIFNKLLPNRDDRKLVRIWLKKTSQRWTLMGEYDRNKPVFDVIFPVNLIWPFFPSWCYYQISGFNDILILYIWIFWWC